MGTRPHGQDSVGQRGLKHEEGDGGGARLNLKGREVRASGTETQRRGKWGS